ncbi:MAG: 30S ribosomal protein S12 methylthiotransferase RimO [Erysipelotrichaceae bacterium]|nr:30S ribosomal protein S12 methylthiotransferase RimO [Erysipelotrichaceae bacterium]
MKLYMVSLGCAKNQVDSEMILGVCKRSMEIVATPDEADVIIVNTCAFIEPARKEAIETILDLSDYKKDGKKLIVCGCLPQRYKEEIINLLPEVDRFVRIDEYKDLPNIINSVINSSFDLNEYDFNNRIYSTPDYMRYVKISEGCMNHCAFCAIPLIRGRLKSRTIESIKEEVLMHVKGGVYEINLISQDTTKYGFDIYNKLMIVELLKELVSIEGDFRIRLLYLYPDIVTDELIEFIKNNPKVMPYFDIPIQHSEDKLLKKMYRRGNREYLLNLFDKIKASIPHAILRTTLIVGFPYEEEEDIDSLIEFIKEVKFDRLGAFTFSLEEGTKAVEYPNDIPEDVKQRRYERVMEAQQEIILAKNKVLIGSVIDDAFIIGYDEESFMYVARSYAYAPDEIDGCIFVAARYELNLGQRVKVKILDCDEYSLTGEQVE